MQVSSSDHCERTILFTVSIFAKGQVNEQCLLGNAESWNAWAWCPQTFCWEDSLVADAAVLRRPEILSLLEITLPVLVRSRVSRALNKLCHAERTSTCLSSMPCRCYQSVDGTFVQLSSSYQSPVPNRENRCRCQAVTTAREFAVFSVSRFAKGQFNDQCLLGNVESWESWNLADTWNPVSLNIKKLLPCLAIVQCIAGVAHQLIGHLCSYPVHISRQYRTDSTDAGVKQWPLWENHSLHSFHFPKGSGQWTVSPWQCWEMKSLSTDAGVKQWPREPFSAKGTNAGTILFTVSIFAKVRSMKSVFSARLRVQKPEFSRHPETLCWEEGFVSDASVWRLAGILSLPGITLPVPVPSQKEQSIEMHWTNFAMLKGQTFALVQCSAHVANWWDIRAAILFTLNHHYRTESTDAGVSKWPLWDNHSLHSFQIRKGSDQWRVSPSQGWELKRRSFPDTLNNLALGRVFFLWCFCVKACRNPVTTRNHVACSSSEPERAVPCWKDKHLP